MTRRERHISSRRCKLAECDNYHEAKGYCSNHYKKFKQYGDPRYISDYAKGIRPRKNTGQCVVIGCIKEGDKAGQMCYGHYMRNYRTGNPLSVNEQKAIFFNSLLSNPTSECVLWPFAFKDNGYGLHNYTDETGVNKGITAHRYVLWLLTGQNPDDKSACHGPCHNRACVNPHPEHGMYWGTHYDNHLDRYRDGTLA